MLQISITSTSKKTCQSPLSPFNLWKCQNTFIRPFKGQIILSTLHRGGEGQNVWKLKCFNNYNEAYSSLKRTYEFLRSSSDVTGSKMTWLNSLEGYFSTKSIERKIGSFWLNYDFIYFNRPREAQRCSRICLQLRHRWGVYFSSKGEKYCVEYLRTSCVWL